MNLLRTLSQRVRRVQRQQRVEHEDRNGLRDWSRTECRSSSRKPEDLLQLVPIEEAQGQCPICLEDLWDPEYTQGTKKQPSGIDHLPVCPQECPTHHYHMRCLRQCLSEAPRCALCRKQLVVITGYQPHTEESSMRYAADRQRLAGHDDCGTLVIHFHIGAGTQGLEHPIPGEPFPAFDYVTYLPDNSEGHEVLRMLELAWKRGLLFRIGFNPATKRKDVIVPNGIELKTKRTGNPQQGGWPDVSYMSRLKSDLKEVGIQ